MGLMMCVPDARGIKRHIASTLLFDPQQVVLVSIQSVCHVQPGMDTISISTYWASCACRFLFDGLSLGAKDDKKDVTLTAVRVSSPYNFTGFCLQFQFMLHQGVEGTV
jgi:hypothetical protein